MTTPVDAFRIDPFTTVSQRFVRIVVNKHGYGYVPVHLGRISCMYSSPMERLIIVSHGYRFVLAR